MSLRHWYLRLRSRLIYTRTAQSTDLRTKHLGLISSIEPELYQQFDAYRASIHFERLKIDRLYKATRLLKQINYQLTMNEMINAITIEYSTARVSYQEFMLNEQSIVKEQMQAIDEFKLLALDYIDLYHDLTDVFGNQGFNHRLLIHFTPAVLEIAEFLRRYDDSK